MPNDADRWLDSLARDGVARDWVDLRDIFYEPTLGTLAACRRPTDVLYEACAGDEGDPRQRLRFGVRDQGRSGRCTGHALAALIDCQRRLQCGTGDTIADEERASADMLYFMARFHDQYTLVDGVGEDRRAGGGDAQAVDDAKAAVALDPETRGVRSLRSVIKGLYHHGVFIDHPERAALAWRGGQTLPGLEQAAAARTTGLGAYYRMHPILNHYHAALNDTGTILVSASLHRGWHPDRVRAAGGVIEWQGEIGEGTQHAFVIVGYTAEGFLVLNSWGAPWGGYDGYEGVALWRYADWARNVVDGWVLRLGVSAPSAFDVSIGEHGLAHAYGAIRSSSTPCLELLGHYVHLDDGEYAELSPYPTNAEMIEETFAGLSGALARGESARTPAPATPTDPTVAAHGVLLWLSGSLEGMKACFETAVRRKREVQSLGLHPLFVFWCNDFVEDAIGFLRHRFERTADISGHDAEHRDRLIENSVRGTGRAFWREVESCARRAVWGPLEPEHAERLRETEGPLGELMQRLYDTVREAGAELHIVADGAGALVLDEMVRLFARLDAARVNDLAGRVRSLNLVLPTISVALARERLLPLMALMNERAANALPGADDGDLRERPPAAARVHVAAESLERRVVIGDYGKSVLHLIANAFEDREVRRDGRGKPVERRPRTLLGMARAIEEVARDDTLGRSPAELFRAHERLAGPATAGPVEQVRLSRDPGIERDVLAAVGRHACAPRPASGGAPAGARAVLSASDAA